MNRKQFASRFRRREAWLWLCLPLIAGCTNTVTEKPPATPPVVPPPPPRTAAQQEVPERYRDAVGSGKSIPSSTSPVGK